MRPVAAVTDVLDAIRRAKAGASAFCTNFFPVQSKLQDWIDRGQLLGEVRDGAVFFFRKDRDFWHLYYCASDATCLEREILALPVLKAERVVVDLVGNEALLIEPLRVMESVGLRRHARLLRLARLGQASEPQPPARSPEVGWADNTDCSAILNLLERSFDRYADQLPADYDIAAAVAKRQILTVKHSGALAALLLFERQGFTSTVRYWVVDQRFRSQRFGSLLMRRYFAVQAAVRRFILWVTANNEDAVAKYAHYGYAPDGLIDYVLVNEMVPK